MLSFTTNALALAHGPHLAMRPAILRGAASSSTTPLMMASEGPSNSLQAKALAAALATTVAAHAGPAAAAEPWAYSTLLERVSADGVSKVAFSEDGAKVVAFDGEGRDHAVQVFPGADAELVKELQKNKVSFAVVPKPEPNQAVSILQTLGGVFLNFLPIFLLIGLNVLASRGGGGMPGGGMGGGGPMGQMGKSQSKIELEPNTGVTFEDVAGADGAKLELTEIVEFLKNPGKYAALGAKIPRGAIMEGPPGTGKTLLARAVAGEAGVPFVAASGSEFVEMFVGLGASRVRDLFEQAKKNAPCIIFIDEIDAVGRQRGAGMAGGNDEREQTLNQILTEMDGFEGNPGIICIAATNRADVLDNALLRPGRFDRRIIVDLPDFNGRTAILKVHARGKPLAPGVDLEAIARRTPGFSGASLQNLMNEAAIYTVRRGKTEIGYEEIDSAVDRIMVGLEKKGQEQGLQRKELVAFHEAGHAVVGAMVPDYDMVQKITIIPRTNGAGGLTFFAPSDARLETGLYSRQYLESQLAVALGGRLAEEVIFGEDQVTTGASNDLQQVASIARRMVTQWGFAGDELGMTAWEENESSPFAAKPTSSSKEAAIDRAVQALCEEAFATCYSTLSEAKPVMEELRDMLLEKETVQGDEVVKLVKKFKGEPVDVPVAAEPVAA